MATHLSLSPISTSLPFLPPLCEVTVTRCCFYAVGVGSEMAEWLYPIRMTSLPDKPPTST